MFQKDKLNEYINEYIIVESLLQDGRSIDQMPSYFDAAYTIKITPEELIEPLRNLYAAKLIQIDWPSEYENAKVLDEDVFANCWFGLTPLGENIYELTCDDFGLEIVYDDGTSQGSTQGDGSLVLTNEGQTQRELS